MEYLDAGAEGILFVDGNIVYKVGRFRPLAREAEALEVLSAAGVSVPKFYRYDALYNVIVREFVEGRRGMRGADTKVFWELYTEEIQPALQEAGFACGEYKEDSFIVRKYTGEPVMVDLGFLCLIGERLVQELFRQIRQPSSEDSLSDLESFVRSALFYKEISPEQATELANELAGMFGEDNVSDLRSLIRSETRTANPSKKKGITRKQFGDEFAALAHRAGLKDVCAIEFTSEVRISPRSYADVDPRKLHFRFAPETLELPAAHRRGLIMHEIGHVLCRDLPDGGTEDDADEAAYEAFGERIAYDCRWPGKGLQYIQRSNR
jgi:tRNA A-37 threonylcarbamoyl transferase component Bud32